MLRLSKSIPINLDLMELCNGNHCMAHIMSYLSECSDAMQLVYDCKHMKQELTNTHFEFNITPTFLCTRLIGQYSESKISDCIARLSANGYIFIEVINSIPIKGRLNFELIESILQGKQKPLNNKAVKLKNEVFKVQNSQFGDGELHYLCRSFESSHPNSLPNVEEWMKFLAYWTALVHKGKDAGKELWRTEKTFALNLRLSNWKSNYYNKNPNGFTIAPQTIQLKQVYHKLGDKID